MSFSFVLDFLLYMSVFSGHYSAITHQIGIKLVMNLGLTKLQIHL